MFGNKKYTLPVTKEDKDWIEQSLLSLSELFGETYFKSLETVIPIGKYFGKYDVLSEEEAGFILKGLMTIMNIDGWEIELFFYSNEPTEFSEGIVATPSDKLNGAWKSSSGKYLDKGFGNKEIWIELRLLKDIESLISTMANELAKFKLLEEYNVQENDEFIIDLTVVAFGLGIFKGNSYFKFAQWTGVTHQGWRMKKSGYLPEQVIAYAMAWLAHYRNEDISWKKYMNKTMKKYFEQGYGYIEQNKELISWEKRVDDDIDLLLYTISAEHISTILTDTDLNGKWNGYYILGNGYKTMVGKKEKFVLNISVMNGIIDGICIDENSVSVEPATITGNVNNGSVVFFKQYPITYIIDKIGARKVSDEPSNIIEYIGKFNPLTESFQGTWKILNKPFEGEWGMKR